MYNYNLVYEKIQNLYNSGSITYEQAVEMNDMAYDKFISESKAIYPMKEVVTADGKQIEGTLPDGSVELYDIYTQDGRKEYHDEYRKMLDKMNKNEKVVEESARSKYVSTLIDKQNKIKVEMNAIKEKISNPDSNTDVKSLKEKLFELRNVYDKLADEASEYSAKIGKATGNAEQKNINDGHLYSHTITDNYQHSKRYDANRKDDEKAHKELDDRHDLGKFKNKNGKVNLGTGKDTGSDHGEYNRYGTRSYRHSDSTHDKGAKRNFSNMKK